ncbi:MAG: uroporphyrinogen decarboxylase [Deltaproteobacteria bacterium]|jgi:uroporphyrinogen decarboxylase|nr:uroporphyrinogen decarboxylase [Deltaproteobacteria bacterium]
MNDRELVEKAMAGQAVPRVPVGFWFHFLSDAEMGDGLFDKTVLERNLKGHRDYLETFKPDLVKIMTDGYFTYPLAGGVREIKTIAELELIEPLGPDHPWIRDQVKLAQTVTQMKPDTCYFYNIFSASTTLRFMVGRNVLVEWLGKEEKVTAAALGRLNAGLKTLTQAIIKEGGADGLYLSVQNPDIGRLGDWLYQELIAPGEIDLLNSTNALGAKNILHICGYEGVRNNFLPYRDYPAAIYSWAANVEKFSLAQGQKFFQGRCVLGGFPNAKGSLLQTGQKQDVVAFAKNLVAEAGRLGVIVGADCTIPQGIPYERLGWVREALAS